MVYFTGDMHFGHAAIITYGRPFESVQAMGRAIIQNWNEIVQPDDTVYILGDFWYKGAVPAIDYAKQLKGHKVLLTGNHDWYWIHKQPEALRYFERVTPYLEYTAQRPAYNLCHYPMLEWNGERRGRYMIHGHTHATPYHAKSDRLFRILREMPLALNACADINQFTPVTLEQLIANNNRFYGMKFK